MNIQRILVPVDYSSCSRTALEFAMTLAAQLGASLDVVHAWDRPSYISDAVLNEPSSGTSLVRMIQENAQRELDDFLGTAKQSNAATLTGRLISGAPASALLRELRHGSFGLVIMGTHGRTGLSQLLLGSVAERLVRLSPVPVLTVPDTEAQAVRRLANPAGAKAQE